ncbi:hypothetical protein AB6O49_34560 [Streptomyces sp. SBR177]
MASALAEMGDPAAAPVLTAAVRAAVRHKQWRTAVPILEALASSPPRRTRLGRHPHPDRRGRPGPTGSHGGRRLRTRTRPRKSPPAAGGPARHLPVP